VIRTVAHQSLQLNDLPGRHLIFFFYLFRMKIFYCGLPSGRLGKTDHHLICSQLEKIPVARKYGHVHSAFLASSGQGSQKIVRLVTCEGNHFYFHGSQHFFHKRNLFPKFLRHAFTGSLVRFIYLMAERGFMKIESHCEIIRFLFLQDPEQNVQKAVNRPRMFSLRVGKIRKPVERPVQYAVSVDQQNFFTQISVLLQRLLSKIYSQLEYDKNKKSDKRYCKNYHQKSHYEFH